MTIDADATSNLITQQLDAAATLLSAPVTKPAHDAWRTATKTILERAFPMGSTPLARFERTQVVTIMNPIQGDPAEASRRKMLEEAVVVLRSIGDGLAAEARVTRPTPRAVQQTFNAPVGSVQNGDGNVANVTMGAAVDVSELRRLLDELSRAVEHEVLPEQIVEAREYVALAKREIEHGTPSSWTSFKLALKALKPIGEGSAAGVVGGLLTELLKKLLLDTNGGL